jgi:YidC/Oxa1 family membrane protein insertase
MMEKRAIIAVGLMLALLVVYQTFFLPQAPVPTETAPAPGVPAPKAAAPASSPAPAPDAKASSGAPAEGAVPQARPPQRVVPVDAPLHRGSVSSEGGKLQEWALKYRGDKPLVILNELGPTGLIVTPQGVEHAAPLSMSIAQDSLVLDSVHPKGELVLDGREGGLGVKLTLGFRADTFDITTRVRLENGTPSPQTVNVALPWRSREAWPDRPERFTGQHPTEVVWATANGHIERVEDLAAVGNVSTEGRWIGIGSVTYLAAMVPKSGGFHLVASADPKPKGKDGKPADGYVTIEVRASPTIAPGQAWEGEVVTYVGPKEYERLQALGLEGAINFGGFPVPRKYGGLPMEWLGVPILLLLKWVHGYVGNYGVAIIVLTIVSKALFYPLTVKSMRSMKAMQTLAPQVNALRSKYKGDTARLQKETMELYRKHNVNPMGGCLPMVAQIPVFYALYLALSVSVELQNATFGCFGRLFGTDLWICDLAAHDPTYVLPVLMGISMFVQQKLTPTAADPRQAKMMLVMPVVFTFMFVNLPAGLVLYWTVSNVLQILQQKFMDRSARGASAGREAKDAARG